MSKKKKEEQTESSEIIKSFGTITTRLDKQISNITLRQQELQNYIIMINNHIVHFDQMINKEMQSGNVDYKKIAAYRNSSFKNIELITVLHTTYKGYEEVKFRYFKEISDSNYKQQKLISVDMKRLGKSDDMSGEFFNIMRNLSKLNVVGDEAKTQIDENNKLLGVVRDGLNCDEYEMM